MKKFYKLLNNSTHISQIIMYYYQLSIKFYIKIYGILPALTLHYPVYSGLLWKKHVLPHKCMVDIFFNVLYNKKYSLPILIE